MARKDTRKPTLIVFDWKDEFPFDAVYESQATGRVYMRQVPNTGSDSVALYMSVHPMTDEDAQLAWDEFDRSFASGRFDI